MNFVMVDGRGNPNTAQDYSDAVEALYSAAYAVKLLSRRILGRDYVVPPLEGLSQPMILRFLPPAIKTSISGR